MTLNNMTFTSWSSDNTTALTVSPISVVRLGATFCILEDRYVLSSLRYSASSITRVAKRSMLIRSMGEMSMPTSGSAGD